MADVAETTTYADAATAISQGKRHLLVQDYTAAVTAFAEGLEMLSSQLGDCDDELGEPYLLYGRALLGLAREEAGVLGGGVPGTEDDEEIEEEDVEDEVDEDKASEADEKDEPMEVSESSEKKESMEVTEPKEKKESVTADSAKEEIKEDKKEGSSIDDKPAASNKTDDKKIEEKKLEASPEKPARKQESSVESVAGSSKEPHINGSASLTDKNCNGAAKSEEADDDEDVNKEDDEEDPGRGIDLQVAWEVLELAKMVFVKRGESGLKHLAETHRLLGEVAMESDNPQGAITDLEGALKLLQKMEPCEPRAIAELHYQLGLAHSLLNDFDASIEQFKEATTLLEGRIKQLEDLKEPPAKSDDPFYSVEGEIKELKELLPAIQEKITDMKDFKEEACRLVIEGIKSKVAGGGCTNGAGTSNEGASSSSQSTVSPKTAKPASDISHLVRKKRKADEAEPQAPSPCKKPTP